MRRAGASASGAGAGAGRPLRFFFGRSVSGSCSVTSIGRLDCGVLENRVGLSASADRGAGKVIARLGGAAAGAAPEVPAPAVPPEDAVAEEGSGGGASGRTACTT